MVDNDFVRTNISEGEVLKHKAFKEKICDSNQHTDSSASNVEFLQCWEVLIYIGLNPVDKYTENFVSIISNHVKYDILGKDYGTSGKQLFDVPSDDQEISFVMFRSEANEASNTVQMDDNLANQEEQLQKLVQEKVNQIKLIAEKVTVLHLGNKGVAVD